MHQVWRLSIKKLRIQVPFMNSAFSHSTPTHVGACFRRRRLRASTSVIQREFAEKHGRRVSPDEVHCEDRTVLGQNVSRANPEKTIQIARRFKAVRTTTRRMAIDPECATRTVKTSGGRDNSRFSQHRAKDSAEESTHCLPPRVLRPGIKSKCPPMPDA